MFVPFALVYMIQNGLILLLERGPHSSFGAGFYGMPGGKIDGNESAKRAAAREAYEEVGVVINEDDLEFAHTFHRKGETEELFVYIFKATSWQGEPFNKEPNKHAALRWFPVTALPENILPAHRQAIECILQGIAYGQHGW